MIDMSAKTNAVDFALNPAGLNTSADLSSISPNKTRHSRKMLHVFMFAHVTGIHSSLVFFHSSPMWTQGLSPTSSCKPVPLLNNYGTILHYQQCGGPTLVVEHDQNVR